MKENNTPEVTVVIVNDSSNDDCESLGLLKDKKLFSLIQIKSYLHLALTLAEWDEESILDLIKLLEILMDNIPAKEVTHHFKYKKNKQEDK